MAVRAASGPHLDPGDPLLTPAGTGPLGHPVGTGISWGDPGNVAPGDCTVDVGPAAGAQDGSGAR